MRNYLGESLTFSFFIKSYLLLIVLFLAPIGLVGEIIKKSSVEPAAFQNQSYTPEIVFNLLYLLLVVVIFTIIL